MLLLDLTGRSGRQIRVNIKCRSAKLEPSAVVLVATIRALKYHGGIELDHLNQENLEALNKGFKNLKRHINNIQKYYGLNAIVSINHFTFDTDDEIELIKKKCKKIGVKCVISKHWSKGSQGAKELATEVLETIENDKNNFKLLYEDSLPLWDKIEKIATKIYKAKEITASAKVRSEIDKLQKTHGELPICMAKTQMSFSTDPSQRCAPKNHIVEITDVKLENGAGFIVAFAGDIMTMPGLPKVPTAEKIDIDNQGVVTGLF